MGKAADQPVEIFKSVLRAAWNKVLRRDPGDKIYAFGVWTTPAAEGFTWFACSERGLRQVAEKYVKNGHRPDVDTAMKDLRWALADSPYLDMPLKGVPAMDDAFDDRPDIEGLDELAHARESRFRFRVAIEALKQLDAEGLFGTGDARERIVLLLEAGDRDNEWAMKWAKQLNPKSVFEFYRDLGKRDASPLGTFTEFGTKKVYATKRFALSADRKLIAAATQYHLCVFGTDPLKQRLAIPLPDRQDYEPLEAVGMSRDGGVVAAVTHGGSGMRSMLCLCGGPEWASRTVHPLPGNALDCATDPAGAWTLVSMQDNAVYVVDHATGATRQIFVHKHWPRSVDVSPDGSMAASACAADGVFVWRTSDWARVHHFPHACDHVRFDAAGRRLVTSLRYPAPIRVVADVPPAGALYISDLADGSVREVPMPGFRALAAAFSPGGDAIACAVRKDESGDRYAPSEGAALIDIASGKITHRLRADFEDVNDFAFLPHRDEIAVAVYGHTRRPLVLWQVGEATA